MFPRLLKHHAIHEQHIREWRFFYIAEEFNRPTETEYGNTRYEYVYGANGQVAKVRFKKNGTLTRTFETEQSGDSSLSDSYD